MAEGTPSRHPGSNSRPYRPGNHQLHNDALSFLPEGLFLNSHFLILNLTRMTEETFPILIGGEEVLTERQLLTQTEDGPMMREVKYLVVHCSATRCNRDYTAEQLLRDHKARGFRTVGYHFYIRRSGVITQHRRLLEVGAHCRPWNRCSIGICYEGGLDAEGHPADTRTPEQYEQLMLLLMKLKKLFPEARIRGHRDMPGSIPKACPCFDCSEYGFLEK